MTRNHRRALVPWNTCGAFLGATLGVATFLYFPSCVLNLINPLTSILFGFTGFRIRRVDQPDPSPVAVAVR